MTKRKKKSKRQTKKQNLKSCSACFFTAKKKYSDGNERKAEETLQERVSALENKHILSLRGNERIKQQSRAGFRRKDKKKAQISRHKLTPLKHSYTNNVLCYPIRCRAIRSLERRFQEKRQSSVSRGGVVLVLLVFFARIVLF